jgi:glutamine amidotransferase
MQLVSIVDYGMGNLRSVQKSFERIGASTRIIADPTQLKDAQRVVIPGVGHFKNAMDVLTSSGFADQIREFALIKQRPVLGICLGMQLMTSRSEEGDTEGFGFVEAETRQFHFDNQSKLKVPHMGWNSLIHAGDHTIGKRLKEVDLVYFVHSYFVTCKDSNDVLFKTAYGNTFDAAFMKHNIVGFQFHPEKSHQVGLQLLKDFLSI